MLVVTKHTSSESTPSGPLTLALSPNPKDGFGERVEIPGNADPGRPQRGRRSQAPAAAGTLG
jgi:hypothetical protein